MNRYSVSALHQAVQALQSGIAAQAKGHKELSMTMDQLRLQLAALQKVMAEINLPQEPDANGWIARRTLR